MVSTNLRDDVGFSHNIDYENMDGSEMEEFKGTRPAADSILSADSENYDTFDGAAAKLGQVAFDSISQISTNLGAAGGKRRITSMQCIKTSRTANVTKPPPRNGTLEKFSPAIFKRWQSRHIELENGILKYFKEKNGKRDYSGILNFDLYQCFVEQTENKKR